MNISCQFDAGSIEVIECKQFDYIQLSFRKDNAADFKQWFYFKLQGATAD